MAGAVAHLSLPAGYILAGLLSCGPQTTPDITVTLQNNTPQINNEQSSEQMVKMKGDSVSPSYGGEFPIVDGITNGVVQIGHDISFSSTVHPFLGSACVAADTVHITVTYSPTIYVDSRYAQGSCRYDLTKEHEMRHVQVDVDTINEFIPYIKQLTEAATEQWKNNGSVREPDIETTQKGMSQEIDAVLKQATENLQNARSMRQPLVDSHEEYKRVSEACRDEGKGQ